MKKPFNINPLWLLVIAIMLLLVAPRIIKDGMFMDGVLYSSVANNMAKGIGTFWLPSFGQINHIHFHEQPTLGFGIQSLFLYVFGSSLYVDRFYGIVMLLLNAFLIRNIWFALFSEAEDRKYSWLPVLLWISIPTIVWGFSNNILENTMSVFVLLSVWSMLKGIRKDKIIWIIAGGVFVVLASMTKGIQGSFSLAFPFLFYLATRKITFKKAALYTVVLGVVFIGMYLLLLLNPDARESFERYYVGRVLNSIQNVSNTSSRFYLVGRLAIELLAPVLIGLLFYGLSKLKKGMSTAANNTLKKEALAFLLLGLAGSIPLMVTREQRGFYINTSLPYYCFAIALFYLPYVKTQMERVLRSEQRVKVLKAIGIAGIFAAVVLTGLNAGKVGRDKEVLHDVHLLKEIAGEKAIIGESPSLFNEWSLKCYLIRYYGIDVNVYEPYKWNYFITKKGELNEAPEGYEKLPVETAYMDIYRAIETAE